VKICAIIKKDRQTYYESLIQAVALRLHSYYRKDNEGILEDYNRLYKTYVISEVPLNSQWSYDLLNQYI
jgi:predicted transcriptional regulator